MIAHAKVRGAVSLVNALATGRGATLGIDAAVEAHVEATSGSGITVESENRNISSRLIRKTITRAVPKRQLERHKLHVQLESSIPTGRGLKSSSAISTSVALACAKLFWDKMNDSQVLLAGVNASIQTRVSVTGAYDDACACYYGGFVVTDNLRRRLIHRKKCPQNLHAVIHVPRSGKRASPSKLKPLRPVFERAWRLARDGDYWNAMVLNGMAISPALGSDPRIIAALIEKGALGASISGNGPALAAITDRRGVSAIRGVFEELGGKILVAPLNNKKAEVH